MRVAIIGPGKMGMGIAQLLLAKDHEVLLAHRELDVASKCAAELGGSARGAAIGEAAQAADLIVLAVPFGAVGAAIDAAGDLRGKTLVDITNPISPDYMALTIGHTTSAAEEIAKLAPGAHVVKAFNTVFWQVLPFEMRRGKVSGSGFACRRQPDRKGRCCCDGDRSGI